MQRQCKFTIIRPSSSVAWGFRLKGGKEFIEPLTIKLVFPNSPSADAGLLSGDKIESVCDRPMADLKHQEAIEWIKSCGNKLNLTVVRSAESNPPTSTPTPTPSQKQQQQQVKLSVSESSAKNLPPEQNESLESDAQRKLRLSCAPTRLKPPVPLQSGTGTPQSSTLGTNQTTSNIPPKDGVKAFPDQELYVMVSSDPSTDQSSSIKLIKCNACLETITGQYFTVKDKAYCEKDYRCSECNLGLAGRGCFIDGSNLLCKEDYQKKNASKCKRCSLMVTGSIVTALGTTWHNECFLCSHCNQPIGSHPFHTRDESNDTVKSKFDGIPNIYCEKCFEEHYAPKCFACHKSISDESRYFQLMGRDYHDRCFTCAQCHCSLKDVQIVKRGEEFICSSHVNRGRVGQ